MVKLFCDLCDKEITEYDKEPISVRYKGVQVSVNVSWLEPGIEDEAICRKCVDIALSLIIRPDVREVSPPTPWPQANGK